jgi:hypothetical protein
MKMFYGVIFIASLSWFVVIKYWLFNFVIVCVFHYNKTDRHDLTEILLKVALSTINQSKPSSVNNNKGEQNCHDYNLPYYLYSRQKWRQMIFRVKPTFEQSPDLFSLYSFNENLFLICSNNFLTFQLFSPNPSWSKNLSHEVYTEIMLSDIVALYNVVESIHKIEIVRHSDLNKTIYLTCIPLLIFRRTWEIWGNPILGHMRVTLCAIQWKWRLRNYDSVIKLLCP